MKALGLVFVAAFVGACSESGAHLSLSAPDGPADAVSFRLILATPDPVPQVANQRVRPGDEATQTVPYYLQRTTAGAESIDHVDGLRIRLAPDVATDTKFIPFVLLYNRDGAIVGIAKAASPVIVVPDEIDKYVLTVEPVTQVDDEAAPAPGQIQVVECEGFTSGIVWRPREGGELRLLFPSDGGLDATGRELDLDCDGHAVTEQSSGRDCDDARPWINRDAIEMCDGVDTNCDGQDTLVVACGGNTTGVCPDPATGTGVALCDDRTGTVGQCMSDAQCLCATQQSGCTRCLLSYAAGASTDDIAPCQPGIGVLSTTTACSASEPCTVEVINVAGGWKADVASDLQNPSFGSSASGVGGKVMLRVKRPEGSGFAMTKQLSLGEVDLLITTKDGQTHFKGVDLGPGGDVPVTCGGSGSFSMVCSP